MRLRTVDVIKAHSISDLLLQVRLEGAPVGPARTARASVYGVRCAVGQKPLCNALPGQRCYGCAGCYCRIQPITMLRLSTLLRQGGVTAGRRSVANVRALYRHGPSMNVQALVGSGKPSQSKGAIAQIRTKVRRSGSPRRYTHACRVSMALGSTRIH